MKPMATSALTVAAAFQPSGQSAVSRMELPCFFIGDADCPVLRDFNETGCTTGNVACV